MNRARQQSFSRLFVWHAALALVPVLIIGIALSFSYRAEARQRGLAEGRSEAGLIGRTGVEPILDGRSLARPLTSTERTELTALADRTTANGDVLRMRLRNTAGRVVFSLDPDDLSLPADDEAISAAHGTIVARLTTLNDDDPTGPRGPAAVEVYLPVHGTGGAVLGVLEIYLPYAPISADVNSGLHRLYEDLILGLLLLYVAILLITWSVSRGLRRESVKNLRLAQYDTLTGLPNRSLFLQRAASVLEQRRANPGPDGDAPRVVIAIADVDRFKEVNDTLGHVNGDGLITQLADRLARRAGPDDTIARLGGDEFGILLTDPVATADPDATLRALREELGREALAGGVPISVEASFGYAVAPDHGDAVDGLLQRADIAMYAAKAGRLGVVGYRSSQVQYDAAGLALLNELRHAIGAGELELHYQPKSRLSDGTIRSVEALVRWRHPKDGLLTPGTFLPLAEQTDVIFELTDWVLARALADLAHLPNEVGVAVNISARSLANADFARSVIDALSVSQVDPARLILEVTETALVTDPPRAAELLGELAAGGVRVSLDDFGCGQTSLGYLASLPIHELKIDMSFISDMLENAAHAAIVASIVELGHNLSLNVVGEGVETADVLERLKVVGCDDAQGYFICRPVPLSELRTAVSLPSS